MKLYMRTMTNKSFKPQYRITRVVGKEKKKTLNCTSPQMLQLWCPVEGCLGGL